MFSFLCPPFPAQAKGARLVSATSMKDSPLEQLCDLAVRRLSSARCWGQGAWGVSGTTATILHQPRLTC